MEKFSGRKPVMFYQEGKGGEAVTYDCSRVRIFYPGGKTEWATLSPYHNPETSDLFFRQPPCWAYRYQPKSMKQAIAMANDYDEDEGFPKMVFLGEL